jgi:hypothetical protein
VAKAAKAAGIEDTGHDERLAGGREALIEELRAQREAAAREAEAAHAAELAGAEGGEIRTEDRGFVDPFRS